jgi:hypothetical protein
MTTEEVEIGIEIVCTNLPGEEWNGQRALCLGLQRDDEIVEAASAGLTRLVFRPLLRTWRNTDGSANFLGAFAHGPRTEGHEHRVAEPVCRCSRTQMCVAWQIEPVSAS